MIRAVQLLLSISLTVSLVSRPTLARGQDEVSAEDRGLARQHTQLGRQLQRDGKLAEAIAEYQLAYQLAPLPDLLFNIAQCHRLLGDSFLAMQFYRRYIAADPEGRGADEARVHLQNLAPELDKAREPDWSVDPPPLPVTPPPPTPPDDRTRRLLHSSALVAMLSGGICLGVAATFALRAESVEDELDASPSWSPDLDERIDDGRRWDRLATYSALTGAVLLVSGATTWVLTRPPSPRTRDALTILPRVSPTQVGVGLDLSF